MALAMERDRLEIVSADTLERELSFVRGAAAGPLPGIFGPRSITWGVSRMRYSANALAALRPGHVPATAR
jgi:hypothetical protein